ncbi:MAG: hypothetical protein AAFX93_20545 [Verrucomicrobiota bacterium]
MADKKKIISARQASWYFLQALEAAENLSERMRLILMLCEEIFFLEQQLSENELKAPSWDIPSLSVETMEEALEVGYQLAARMQDLRNFIREETNDKVWPESRYDKRTIWSEKQGSQQPNTNIEDVTPPCELDTWAIFDGGRN